MSSTLKVKISREPTPKQWGTKSITSATTDQITIHISDPAQQLDLIQKAGRQLASIGAPSPHLEGEFWDLDSQWAFAQGFMSPLSNLPPVWAACSAEDLAELNNRHEVISWVREQVNASPEELTPMILASNSADYIQSLKPEAVSFELISGDDLLSEGLVGIHGVGRGSVNPPVLLRLDYNPTGDKTKPVDVALVGKGITFDSGGYSIKSSEGMLMMKMDMGGAAHATGSLALAIKGGLNKRVTLLLCCAENMISGHAYRLGDILHYPNGTSVEIVNTDAEGRLVLADGLLQAAKTGAPLIIDAATLTGAAHVALGSEYNAIFAMDKPLAEFALSCALEENELHWQLPLEKFHQTKCPSPYADTANSRPMKGGGAGGASNAAGFLSRFVEADGKGWLHFDLAGALMSSDSSLWSAGGTAMGVRTIAKILSSYSD
ncbi:aminopeptidase PepB [Candidatus Dependentiae bacterium]|nr:MAG: aminopeptidase PepB [Candidatus Dependentiae bacterium]